MAKEGQSIRRDLKLLMAKLCLLAAPLVGLLFAEAFVLPIDFYAFRCWEALSVRSIKWAFPGPFYPKQQLSRVEIGDLGAGSKHAVRRQVTWITDEFGFRNRESRAGADLDVVIVGDSFIAGTGLTQDEILPEVLEHQTGMTSYGYAPSNMKHFLRDPRYNDRLPKVVIVALAERSLSRLSSISTKPSNARLVLEQLGTNHSEWLCPVDRLIAPYFMQYAQARVRPMHSQLGHVKDGILFVQSDTPGPEHQAALRRNSVSRLREYHQYVTSRGSKFVFLPIPNKEFVYADQLPPESQTSIIPDLIQDLNAEGIPVVDITQALLDLHHQDTTVPLYQSDDTHWGAPAVQLAARYLGEELNRLSMAAELSTAR